MSYRRSVVLYKAMTSLIRDAEPADLPAIVEIYNLSIPGRLATADTEFVTVESRQKWFADHQPQTRPLWVYSHQGKIAAWISLSSFYGRPAYQKTTEVSLYVAPFFQRQGIGSQLLAEMIAQASSFNVTTLLGFIFAHNQPSLKLFRTFQFQQWGYCPGIAELDGFPRDLIILGRQV